MLKIFTAIMTVMLIALTVPVNAKDKDQFSAEILSLLEPKTVFVTTEKFTGNLVTEANSRLGTSFTMLEGLEAGDALCQYLADAPGSVVPKDKYIALLSTDDINASARITPSSGPLVRPDGAFLAAGSVDFLTRDALATAPQIGETGNIVAGGSDVWTGTKTDGTSYSDNCLNWTSYDSNDSGLLGEQDEVNSQWIAKTADPCSGARSLYCVER